MLVAVSLLGVLQSLVLGEHPEARTDHGDGLCVEGELAFLGEEGITFNSDDISPPDFISIGGCYL